MSARLQPGEYNPATLARRADGTSNAPEYGWGSIGHDRYGRSLGHRAENGLPDEPRHAQHAAPDLRPRARTAKLRDVARFTGMDA